ncbi:MAG: P1 family peptidase [Hyphomicrobiales bacterium]|nr:P1 family peptidase [Hyphomicrobiales bacterium]
MNNCITDVPGLKAGNAHDSALASGVTAILFDRPAAASIAILGGAPGVRDSALLEPDMTVPGVDALVLSGGSAFGLDTMGGVQAHLLAVGRGFSIGSARVPIAPGAILFDLLNGGNKQWGEKSPYWDLGLAAARAASGTILELGTSGAGYGATTSTLKGGLGAASAATSSGHIVAAVVAVNAVGSATIGSGPHFWAAPYERNGEFGGLGLPVPIGADALALTTKGAASPRAENTTIAIVATNAPFGKLEAKRIAIMAHDGMSRALRPAHAPFDGDIVFAASTGTGSAVGPGELMEIGSLAADCLARAIARGVYQARALPFPGALPDWKSRFEG